MKNAFNFTIENVSLTIEGQPVQLNGININVESEASVHELATYGGMIKDLVNQIKDLINRPTTPTSMPMPTPVINIDGKRVEPTPSPCPCPTTKPTEKKVIDLKGTFESLEENLIKRGWSTDHLGNLYWEAPKDSGMEFKDAKISLEDAIRLHAHSTQGVLRNVHVAIHTSKVYVDGISTHYLDKFLREAGIPGLEELIPIVKNMEVRA